MSRQEKTCCIYIIRRIGTNECYVGQTVDYLHRWRGHRRALDLGKHRAVWMQRAYTKYSGSAFESFILEVLPPSDNLRKDLAAAEQRWMDELVPCYNTAPVAGSTLGVKFSKASKARVSLAHKKRFENSEARRIASLAKLGTPSGFKGRSHTKKAKVRMRQAKLGKPSNRVGYTHTKETLAKMSAAKKGKPSPNIGTTRDPTSNAKQSASMLALSEKRKLEGINHPNTGRKASDATKVKMRAAKLGKPQSQETRAAQSIRIKAWWDARKAASPQMAQ